MGFSEALMGFNGELVGELMQILFSMLYEHCQEYGPIDDQLRDVSDVYYLYKHHCNPKINHCPKCMEDGIKHKLALCCVTERNKMEHGKRIME